MPSSFEDLDLESLSETWQSRRVETSFANICLLLNHNRTYESTMNYFLTPLVNHHFVDLSKIENAVGQASSLLKIFDLSPRDVSSLAIPSDAILKKNLSNVVIAFYSVSTAMSHNNPHMLYHCVSMESASKKGKCKCVL